MDKPTREQIVKARENVLEMLEWADIYENNKRAVGVLLAAAEPPPIEERPADMADLAQAVARELRKRGIWACTMNDENPPLCAVGIPTIHNGKAGFLRLHSLLFGHFDNLTPTEIADLIQREEAAKAAEWAGDE